MPDRKQARKPGDKALFRKVIFVVHDGKEDERTVRIAAYPPRGESRTPTVTLGIGRSDPEAFAKIFFEVTEENWKVINTQVKDALKAARSEENAPGGSTPAPSRRRRAATDPVDADADADAA